MNEWMDGQPGGQHWHTITR